MIDNDALLRELKADEGFRAKAYWDKKQFTYGYGCAAPNANSTITEPEAARLLQEHITVAVGHFKRLFNDDVEKFNSVRANAIVNMIFNLGPGGFAKFKKAIAAIKQDPPDWKRCAAECQDSAWFKQVGKRAVRICKEIETGVKGV